MKLKEMWKSVTTFTDKNSPAILTGLGVAGLFGSMYMAYKASPKAHDILEKYHEDKEMTDPDDKETKKVILKETVVELTKVMAPSVLMGVATGACIIGANKISTKRIALMSAAYSIADSKLKDYQTKMLESLGEQKVQKVREAIAKDHLETSSVPSDILVPGGRCLCMDAHTGRFFVSSAEAIGQAINSLTADVMQEMYVSLNDFYDKIGLDHIPLGDDLGWNIDDALGGKLPIYFSAILTNEHQPCLVIEADINIRSDFRNLH